MHRKYQPSVQTPFLELDEEKENLFSRKNSKHFFSQKTSQEIKSFHTFVHDGNNQMM